MSGSERRISVVAEDTPEAFLRLTGLLARRGFRFREMSLGRTMRPGLARYTLVLPGDAGTAEQAIRHLDLFQEKADPLRAVARFAVARRS